jgi:hypothetical protein
MFIEIWRGKKGRTMGIKDEKEESHTGEGGDCCYVRRIGGKMRRTRKKRKGGELG